MTRAADDYAAINRRLKTLHEPHQPQKYAIWWESRKGWVAGFAKITNPDGTPGKVWMITSRAADADTYDTREAAEEIVASNTIMLIHGEVKEYPGE